MNIKSIDSPFGIGDATLIDIVSSGALLITRLKDWKEEQRTVKFSGVVAFRWADEPFSEYVFEKVAVVEHSQWLDNLVNNHKKPLDASEVKYSEENWQAENKIEKLKHYILTINALGTLEVVAESISFE